MPTSLQSTLSDLAASFADSILAAIRGASLDDLLSTDGKARGNGRAPRPPSVVADVPAAAKRPRSGGRLPRRSPAEIAKTLDQLIAVVKRKPEGLRAEQIRQELGLEAKEMPRILKAGLDKRVLKSKGQKRATTYFAK